MSDLQVVVQQEPGKVSWNFDELKSQLSETLQVYQTMVYTDDAIPAAKADVAMLRKLKKSVNDKRLEVKKKCLEPYDTLDAQAKELCSIIDEPINYISGRVSQYEKEQREAKRAKIFKHMKEALSDLSGTDREVAAAALEAQYDARWENKTVTEKTWKAAVDDLVKKVLGDIRVIEGMDEDFRGPCMDIYRRTLTLNAAIEKQNELQRQREMLRAAERRREEEKRQREEALRRREEQEKEAAAERERMAAAEAESEARDGRERRKATESVPTQKEEPDAGPFDSAPNFDSRESQKSLSHKICIYSDDKMYQKILGYIHFLGVEFEEI